MKEQLAAFPLRFSGTSAMVDTVTTTAPAAPDIPLHVSAVSLDCDKSAGTVTLTSREPSTVKTE